MDKQYFQYVMGLIKALIFLNQHRDGVMYYDNKQLFLSDIFWIKDEYWKWEILDDTILISKNSKIIYFCQTKGIEQKKHFTDSTIKRLFEQGITEIIELSKIIQDLSKYSISFFIMTNESKTFNFWTTLWQYQLEEDNGSFFTRYNAIKIKLKYDHDFAWPKRKDENDIIIKSHLKNLYKESFWIWAIDILFAHIFKNNSHKSWWITEIYNTISPYKLKEEVNQFILKMLAYEIRNPNMSPKITQWFYQQLHKNRKDSASILQDPLKVTTLLWEIKQEDPYSIYQQICKIYSGDNGADSYKIMVDLLNSCDINFQIADLEKYIKENDVVWKHLTLFKDQNKIEKIQNMMI